jgi:hypothetical protein
LFVNEFYVWAELDVSQRKTPTEGHAASGWSPLTAVFLLALILRATWQARKSAACCGEDE